MSRLQRTIPSLLLVGLCVGSALGAQRVTFPRQAPASEGRVLWLRADRNVGRDIGNTVSSWSGLDGVGTQLTQLVGSVRPLLEPIEAGGHPAVRFDGLDSLASPNGMPTGDYTKIVVVTLADYASTNNVVSGAAEHALFYGGTDRAMLYHSGTFVTSSIATPLDEPTVLVGSYDSTTGEGRLYQNGVLVGTGLAAPHSDPSLQLGSFAGGSGLDGALSEVLIYDRVLDDAERMWIESMLEQRYRVLVPTRVNFKDLPRHGQVVQRDLTDQALVPITGVVKTTGYDTVELKVWRDGQISATTCQALTYGTSGASFTLGAHLSAGLYDYDLSIALLAGSTRQVVARVDDLACGDTLLINGQSNATAPDYWSEGLGNQSQSKWIRSFGSSINSANVEFDRNWGMADGELGYEHCTVGSWGLRAAELLVQQEQVPVGLINGSVGGTAISQHLRSDAFPGSKATIYGRLLFRARRAEMAETARAMIWYQGESDGEAIADYATRFQLLYDAWHQDYPALEKVYVFQIRKGCGVTFSGVREFLRSTQDIYPDVAVMSTTAAPAHDNCHFFYAGYRELGDRIARLLARDLHGSSDTHEIDPPNVLSAQKVGGAGDQILLTFRDPDDALVFETGAEADFILEDWVAVTSGTIWGNQVLLQLAGPTTSATISYNGHAGDGPWFRNARGVGALTFFDLPILP
ncbi:MAG TPA: hypothetical protein EYQ74_14140 [Planctomycetes bacterium]|nr:hypothetical protein [Planctomycetota bacterium]HIK60276.1 hypothetical protein [Planctomycetota bacterium]